MAAADPAQDDRDSRTGHKVVRQVLGRASAFPEPDTEAPVLRLDLGGLAALRLDRDVGHRR
jgi:hypothetical protein